MSRKKIMLIFFQRIKTKGTGLWQNCHLLLPGLHLNAETRAENEMSVTFFSFFNRGGR